MLWCCSEDTLQELALALYRVDSEDPLKLSVLATEPSCWPPYPTFMGRKSTSVEATGLALETEGALPSVTVIISQLGSESGPGHQRQRKG